MEKETRGADPNNLYYEQLDPNREGETYKEFYAASWKAAHGDLKGFYPETYLASARRHFAADNKAILKAYRSDGELAGIVETDTERSKGAGVGWISLVYIKEPLRGVGLGTQLVGRAITNYEMLGRQKARLHVSSENAAAIKFTRISALRYSAASPVPALRFTSWKRDLNKQCQCGTLMRVCRSLTRVIGVSSPFRIYTQTCPISEDFLRK